MLNFALRIDHLAQGVQTFLLANPLFIILVRSLSSFMANDLSYYPSNL